MAKLTAKTVQVEVTPEELSWLRLGLNALLTYEVNDSADERQVRSLYADLTTD